MKVELVQKIMIKIDGFRVKSYSYLKDDANEDKKAKFTKKRVIKIDIKFKNYTNCLEATQIEKKISYLEKK